MGKTTGALVSALALVVVAGAASWANGNIGEPALLTAVAVAPSTSPAPRDAAAGSLAPDSRARAHGALTLDTDVTSPVAAADDQPAATAIPGPDAAPDTATRPAPSTQDVPQAPPPAEESDAPVPQAQGPDEEEEGQLISVEEVPPVDLDVLPRELPPGLEEDPPELLVLDPAPQDLPGEEAHLRELRRVVVAAFDDCFWVPGDPCNVAAVLSPATDLSTTMLFPGAAGTFWPTAADDGTGDLLWDLGVVEVQLLSYRDGSWQTVHVHATARTDVEGAVKLTLARA